MGIRPSDRYPSVIGLLTEFGAAGGSATLVPLDMIWMDDDFVVVSESTGNVLDVLQNDTDPDGLLVPSSVTDRRVAPLMATPGSLHEVHEQRLHRVVADRDRS